MENKGCMYIYYCDKCGKVLETVYSDNEYEVSKRYYRPEDKLHLELALDIWHGPYIYADHSAHALCKDCKKEIAEKIRDFAKELGFNFEEN